MHASTVISRKRENICTRDLQQVLFDFLQGAAAVHAHIDAEFLLCPKGKGGAGIAGWKALFGPTEAVVLPRAY
jgi:hypothetical protein